MIGDGSIATAAKDEKTAHTPVVQGTAGFRPSALARHAGAAESDREEESSDKGLHPRILKALKETMPLKIDSDFMTKAGWVSHPTFPQMIAGHFPTTCRTPATRYPRHVFRTTWVFNKRWVEIEKEVDIRTLDNRVTKLPSESPVLSVTIFKRPPDDPEPEPDSDKEAEAVPSDEKRTAQLKLQAGSLEHKFTRRPKNAFCKVCQNAKMLALHARKRRGSSTIFSKKFGDHVTIDHIVTKGQGLT